MFDLLLLFLLLLYHHFYFRCYFTAFCVTYFILLPKLLPFKTSNEKYMLPEPTAEKNTKSIFPTPSRSFPLPSYNPFCPIYLFLGQDQGFSQIRNTTNCITLTLTSNSRCNNSTATLNFRVSLT